ncbi:hypothetical protein [Vibrio navarrensis]|uniref:hypothetical protein n=1 Tax=Vibrio navarrensis TaxID=29495 RepID=UPI00186A67E6|nr:hypothetical protein [Vibrio navarrensis]MBE4605477.1 hypothetical protein [Vibrio navarrensis]
MISLLVFKEMARKLSIDEGLPRYRSEFIVARSAGALTMPDLMRKLLCEESVKLPKEHEILEMMVHLEQIHKNIECLVKKKEKYYTLVLREEVEQ